jgi:1-acyl-sn-glycerol-3-phosphate acyltransferase
MQPVRSQDVETRLQVASQPRDLLAQNLSFWARTHIKIIRASMASRPIDALLRLGQRTIGATWIEECTKHIRHVHGAERLPYFDLDRSYVVVSNHRSFFDLYVVTAWLVKRGLRHRIMFPVRANFFYEGPLGIVVNFAMSFMAMYPPLFRERSMAAANVASLDETIAMIKGGGLFVGLHPEGTRNKSGDPYTLLPAQSGVGRIIHASRVAVIPAFINGLGNDLAKQVAGNFTGAGDPIHVVFGKPVDFGDLLDRPGSPHTYKRISERCMEVVRILGEEERAHRQNDDRGSVR